MFGQKLLLCTRCVQVGLNTQQEVVAESCPAVCLVILVYQLSERAAAVNLVVVRHLAVDVVKDDVARLRCAVVVVFFSFHFNLEKSLCKFYSFYFRRSVLGDE